MTNWTLGIVLNTLAIYFFLIILLRLIGRRTLAQLSALDLVVIVLLGSAVETSMVRASTSIRAGFISASVLLVANAILSLAMRRWKRFRHILGGGPILLVHNGEFVPEHMRRAGLTMSDVRAALRAREVAHVEDVRFAVLETDGRINVVTKGDGG
jgi:uncharacterized membrane protein YcaP (DUF421 family)